jgi:hypothetical protein
MKSLEQLHNVLHGNFQDYTIPEDFYISLNTQVRWYLKRDLNLPFKDRCIVIFTQAKDWDKVLMRLRYLQNRTEALVSREDAHFYLLSKPFARDSWRALIRDLEFSHFEV